MKTEIYSQLSYWKDKILELVRKGNILAILLCFLGIRDGNISLIIIILKSFNKGKFAFVTARHIMLSNIVDFP